ncbi:Uncharacterised protein [Campylobacter jejuni]|nr:Uncharacterised protein [Campylobacter jejuni]
MPAITYYRTERGQHANSTNRRHYLSDALILGFDAFHLAEILLTQPVLEIPAARHYQIYDVPEYVGQAVDHLEQFFTHHLQADYYG